MHDVDRDDRGGAVLQDALHWTLGGGLEGGVDLLDRDLALDDGREVGQRAVRSRDAEREAVQLAGQLGEDEADRLGGAGRRRDDRERGGAGAAEVAVRSVRDPLVGRVGVDGRHHALLDAERVVEDLDHRGKAVGRAARVGDDVLVARERVLVDTQHDRLDAALGRGRDDDLLGAALEVQPGALGVGEAARRLDDHVGAEVAPGQVGGVPLGEHLEAVPVDHEFVALGRHVAGEDAVHGVVLEEVRERLGVGEVVDRDDVEVGAAALEDGAEHEAADAAEPVDANLDGHGGVGERRGRHYAESQGTGLVALPGPGVR